MSELERLAVRYVVSRVELTMLEAAVKSILNDDVTVTIAKFKDTLKAREDTKILAQEILQEMANLVNAEYIQTYREESEQPANE